MKSSDRVIDAPKNRVKDPSRLQEILDTRVEIPANAAPSLKKPDEPLAISAVITGLKYGVIAYGLLPKEVKNLVDEAVALEAKPRA